ncbi:MAG: hypothetical protein JWO94_2702 [Verrucomicrobiaceae bacterium]|nr:hypothetical protein [Verrucomicrobiaceae bacterium]
MAHVSCVFCESPLPPLQLPLDGGGVQCPACLRSSEVRVFPALLAAHQARPPALVSDPPAEGEAACFYSPQRRATHACAHCGVLISDAWTAHWGSKTYCLKCLEHLMSGKDGGFEASRILWDNIALSLAVVPLIIPIFRPFILISAPASVFLAFWHWSSPRGVVPRGRFRIAAALILGLVQLVVFVLVILQAWFHLFKR